MTMQTSKEQLLAEVQELQSDEIVEQLRSYLQELKQREEMAPHWFDDIPPMPPRSAEQVRADFEQSLRESREGKGIPHAEVVEMFRRRYSK
jgi:hypothetical protein